MIALLSLPLAAQSCFENFNYFQTITLTPPTGTSSIESSTVAIPFNTKVLVDEGKLQADGADLRIADSDCTELPFFAQGVDERAMNVLYVKVPEIPSGGFELQIYYGGPANAENQMNGSATFDFFDDFEDGVINESKWEAIGEYDLWEESNGQMQFTGSYGNGGIFKYVAPKIGFTDPVTFHFSSNASNSQVYGVADTADIKRIGLRYDSGLTTYDTLDIIALMHDTLSGGSNPGIDYPFVQVSRYDLNLIAVSAFIDDNQKLNFTKFENFSSGGFNADTLNLQQMDFDVLRPFFASFGSPNIIEFVGICPAGISPEITYGMEQEIITGTDQISLGELIKIYPVPATDHLSIQTDNDPPEQMTVYTLNGQKIVEQAFEERLDVSFLETGRYILELIYPEGTISKSFVKIADN